MEVCTIDSPHTRTSPSVGQRVGGSYPIPLFLLLSLPFPLLFFPRLYPLLVTPSLALSWPRTCARALALQHLHARAQTLTPPNSPLYYRAYDTSHHLRPQNHESTVSRPICEVKHGID